MDDSRVVSEAKAGRVAKDNNFGVKGIAFEAKAKFSSECANSNCTRINIADAVNRARNATSAGDVILLEAQTWVCGYQRPPKGDKGLGPVEWHRATFDAILHATASGRHVVEAAGNGSVNLDAPECAGVFNRSGKERGDSGAIIVGAGEPPSTKVFRPARSRSYRAQLLRYERGSQNSLG